MGFMLYLWIRINTYINVLIMRQYTVVVKVVAAIMARKCVLGGLWLIIWVQSGFDQVFLFLYNLHTHLELRLSLENC